MELVPQQKTLPELAETTSEPMLARKYEKAKHLIRSYLSGLAGYEQTLSEAGIVGDWLEDEKSSDTLGAALDPASVRILMNAREEGIENMEEISEGILLEMSIRIIEVSARLFELLDGLDTLEVQEILSSSARLSRQIRHALLRTRTGNVSFRQILGEIIGSPDYTYLIRMAGSTL